MKRLQCTYSPFKSKKYPWMLKHPKVKTPLAQFKTRAEAADWYLSQGYECVFWFQNEEGIWGGQIISSINENNELDHEVVVDNFDGALPYKETCQEFHIDPISWKRDEEAAKDRVAKIDDFKLFKKPDDYFPKDDETERPTRKSKKDLEIAELHERLQNIADQLLSTEEEATRKVLEAEEERLRAAEEAARLAKAAEEEKARLAKEAEEEKARLAQEAEEAKLQAAEEARLKAEEEAAILLSEEIRRVKEAEEEARLKAEEEARLLSEEIERIRVEEDERRRLEQEERLRFAEESKLRAEEAERAKAEEEERRRLEEEERLKAEEEARLKAEEEARLLAEEIERIRAEEEERLRAEEEARLRDEEEARLRAEEEARVLAQIEEEERRRLEEEERRLIEEEEARLLAEEIEQLRLEEEQQNAQLQDAQDEKSQMEADEQARLAKEAEEQRLRESEEKRRIAEEEARLLAIELERMKSQEEAKMQEQPMEPMAPMAPAPMAPDDPKAHSSKLTYVEAGELIQDDQLKALIVYTKKLNVVTQNLTTKIINAEDASLIKTNIDNVYSYYIQLSKNHETDREVAKEVLILLEDFKKNAQKLVSELKINNELEASPSTSAYYKDPITYKNERVAQALSYAIFKGWFVGFVPYESYSYAVPAVSEYCEFHEFVNNEELLATKPDLNIGEKEKPVVVVVEKQQPVVIVEKQQPEVVIKEVPVAAKVTKWDTIFQIFLVIILIVAVTLTIIFILQLVGAIDIF